MDDTSLKELLNDLRHMDEPELLAFGRKHRANPKPCGLRFLILHGI
jgi:hypothetical protein